MIKSQVFVVVETYYDGCTGWETTAKTTQSITLLNYKRRLMIPFRLVPRTIRVHGEKIAVGSLRHWTFIKLMEMYG